MSWQISDDDYARWIEDVEQPRITRRLTSIGAAAYDQSWPLISIVVPCYNSAPGFLQEAVESVLAQHYPRWELILVDDASSDENVAAMLRRFAAADERIHPLFRSDNGGIAAATNEGLAAAEGTHVAFMDHDDKLAPQALLLVARYLREHPELRLLYTDSDHLDADGQRSNPFFKPDYNYELLLGQNYFNHLTVYHGALIRNLGGLRSEFDGSQDYDLALRAVERLAPEQIAHMPEILYHWRVVPQSAARANIGQAVSRAKVALEQHLGRSGQSGTVTSPRLAKVFHRVNWTSAGDAGDWAIIRMLAGASGEELNEKAEASDAKRLCFLPEGFEATAEEALSCLAGLLSRRNAGAVSGSMLAPDGRLLQGPVFANGEVLPAFSGASDDERGYFARLDLEQRATVSSLAGLAIDKAVLDDVGGLNPYLHHPLLLGADLALRLRQLDRFTVWTPNARFSACDEHATLSLTAPPAVEDSESFQGRWQRELSRDPFYNQNFATERVDFRLP